MSTMKILLTQEILAVLPQLLDLGFEEGDNVTIQVDLVTEEASVDAERGADDDAPSGDDGGVVGGGEHPPKGPK